jgi:hypothetical protein
MPKYWGIMMVELIIGIIFLLIGFLGIFIRFDWVCKKIYQYEGIFLFIVFMIFIIGFLFLIDGVGIVLAR